MTTTTRKMAQRLSMTFELEDAEPIALVDGAAIVPFLVELSLIQVADERWRVSTIGVHGYGAEGPARFRSFYPEYQRDWPDWLVRIVRAQLQAAPAPCWTPTEWAEHG